MNYNLAVAFKELFSLSYTEIQLLTEYFNLLGKGTSSLNRLYFSNIKKSKFK